MSPTALHDTSATTKTNMPQRVRLYNRALKGLNRKMTAAARRLLPVRMVLEELIVHQAAHILDALVERKWLDR